MASDPRRHDPRAEPPDWGAVLWGSDTPPPAQPEPQRDEAPPEAIAASSPRDRRVPPTTAGEAADWGAVLWGDPSPATPEPGASEPGVPEPDATSTPSEAPEADADAERDAELAITEPEPEPQPEPVPEPEPQPAAPPAPESAEGEPPAEPLATADRASTPAESAGESETATRPAPAARPWHAASELAAWFGLLVGVELWLFGDGVGFIETVPSPYWLPILWLGLRRGLGAALAAAAAATTLLALGTYAAFDVAGWQELLDLGLMWESVLFFAVAFLVGDLRDRAAERYRTLRGRFDRLRDDAGTIRHEAVTLREANRELRRRVFDNTFDFQSVMSALGRSAVDSEGTTFDLPLTMLAEHCGAVKASVLLVLEDGSIDLGAHHGWTDEEIRTRLAAANASARVRKALQQGRAVISPRERDPDHSGPVMIAPISDVTNVTKALVCIDEMPADRFSEATVRSFLGVAEWVAANLRRVQIGRVEDASRSAIAEVLKSKKIMGTPKELSARMFLEDERTRRYGIGSILLSLRVDDDRLGRTADDLDDLEDTLLGALGSAVRATDDVYRFGFPGCYVIVLTSCSAKGGTIVRERLRKHFDSLPPRALGPVEIDIFLPGEEHACLATLLPRVTAHFCERSPIPLDGRCPVPEPRVPQPGNAMDFARRLRLEMEIASRHGLDLSLIDLRANDAETGSGPMIGRHLWNMLPTVLRVSDGIYVLSPTRCIVILPCTTCLDASRVWRRVEDALRRSIPENRMQEVQIDFLALADTDLQSTMAHLVGEEDEIAPVDQRLGESLLSEVELQELAVDALGLAELEGGDAGPDPGGATESAGCYEVDDPLVDVRRVAGELVDLLVDAELSTDARGRLTELVDLCSQPIREDWTSAAAWAWADDDGGEP